MSSHDDSSALNRRSLLTGAAAGVGAAAVLAAAGGTGGSGTAHAAEAHAAEAHGIKLFRFGEPGREKPGVELTDGTRLDVSEWIPDYGPDFFASGGLERLRQVANAEQSPKLKGTPRLGPPIARPGQFLAIGLNYRKHIAEVGAKVPTEPEVFIKLNNCITGPQDDILQPKGSTKLDYEAELAFVIKTRAAYLASVDESHKYVAGFLICNDVSERNFQSERGSQWTKGKGCRSFGPLGPYLVPTEEVGDPHNIDIRLTVNGQIRQNSNTNDLLFNIWHIVWYLSQFFTLEPGDVVTTGTPQGVAAGMKPTPGWIKPGDVVETTLGKLGTQRNTVRALA